MKVVLMINPVSVTKAKPSKLLAEARRVYAKMNDIKVVASDVDAERSWYFHTMFKKLSPDGFSCNNRPAHPQGFLESKTALGILEGIETLPKTVKKSLKIKVGKVTQQHFADGDRYNPEFKSEYVVPLLVSPKKNIFARILDNFRAKPSAQKNGDVFTIIDYDNLDNSVFPPQIRHVDNIAATFEEIAKKYSKK